MNTLNFVQYALVITSILMLTSACTSGSNEPPQDIGIGKPGAVFHQTSLLRIDKKNGIAYYQVKYPVYDLSSTAKIDIKVLRPLMLEQIFSGKWKTVYEYNDKINKYFKIPSGFNIFAFSGTDNYDELISRYELSKLISSVPEEMAPSQNPGINLPKEFFFEIANGVEYKNKNGKKRIFKVVYFDVGQRQIGVGGWPMTF